MAFFRRSLKSATLWIPHGQIWSNLIKVMTAFAVLRGEGVRTLPSQFWRPWRFMFTILLFRGLGSEVNWWALTGFKKAGDEESHDIINTAKDHANQICECANDMMYAGRISGFPGIITKQGLLLLREEATCFKKRSNRKKQKTDRN